MKWLIPIVLCLLIVPPALGQESVELAAPASAVITPDGGVAVTAPEAETPVVEAPPAVADAETPAEPAAADAEPSAAEPAAAVADATPDTIVIPIVDPLDDPSTGDEVVDAAGKVKDAWYNKNYPALAGAIIFLILTLFRLPMLGALTKKIPQRIRILAAVVLSFAAAVLQALTLGVPWGVALMNVLATAPSAVFANELIVESILGNRYKKDSDKTKS